MTVLQAFVSRDMSATVGWTATSVPVSTRSAYVISDGIHSAEFLGSFSYGINDEPSGTVHTFTESLNGTAL